MTHAPAPSLHATATDKSSGTSSQGASFLPSPNPLRRTMALGKMPVILELHLTESDAVGYQQFRQRYLSDAAALPQLTLLGQYMRQSDMGAANLSPEERALGHKLQVYADLINSGQVDLVALDDGARGRRSLDNAVAAELLAGLGVDPARLLANIVARDRLPDQLRRRIRHFADIGIRNALLLTGDLPVDRNQPARFPLDSIGMCQLARNMLIEGDLPENFLIAAAGHPNTDADPDGQRTLHKALAGAKLIITQAIFSFEQFSRWMDALQKLGVLDMVHVLAEVIPITSSRQLGILSDIPGMRVPPELIEEFNAAERRAASTAQAAGHGENWVKQQIRQEGVRVTRSLIHRLRRAQGVSGFYLGCVKSFDAHVELLKETPLLPGAGHQLHKVAKLSGSERQHALAQLPTIKAFLHQATVTARARQRSLTRRVMGGMARVPWMERLLKIVEWPKVPVFACKKCDRCDLSQDALICPRGCAKQMSHGPCGGPRWAEGRMLCEDASRECTWAAIRSRRDLFGVSVAARLEVYPPPSPEFFEGRSYSAFLPVLAGTKPPPDWSLALRAPWSMFMRLFRPDYVLIAKGSPVDLITLVQSKIGQISAMLARRPDMDGEELLIKTLALIGTPAAHHLIEAGLADIGLPAEGCMADLSIRETYLLAEAIPVVRRRATDNTKSPNAIGPAAGSDRLLAVIREGKTLRRALRRERVNSLIRHTTSLGVRVTYTDALLETRSIEDFLQALTILKDELQLARGRMNLASQELSVHFDRVQYKHHYRPPISTRRFHEANGERQRRTQLVVDIRQFQTEERFRANVRDTLGRLVAPAAATGDSIFLEDFANDSQSVCWAFNSIFWSRLHDFEKATGVNYDESIGGSTDHNLAYVRSTARAHFDRMQDHRLRGEGLFVVEIGVAATHRARAFLDELKRISEITQTNCYDQTTYVLADRSVEILERSAADLKQDHPNVVAVRIDAADPLVALTPYKGRVMHVHLCNVYDNLPTDKIARIDGELYRIEGRAYLSRDTFEALSRMHGLPRACRPELQQRLASLSDGGEQGVCDLLDWVQQRLTEQEKPALAYVGWWMDFFNALLTEERYVKLAAEDGRRLDRVAGVDISVDMLRRHLGGERDVHVHVSQQALAGFVQLLEVLHPRGVLEVVDLFVQRIEEYEQRFKGPAKYDGSTVNWLNGPLFREVASQIGYTVRFNSFKPFDAKSASVIMMASKNVDAAESVGTADD